MIIKALFRRYERWNPVHPTYGAFWGMGIGIGCGVGWGPGFGPEVIGYVGSGCGMGFSVGITLIGVGIGLPTNCIIQIPYNAFAATSNGALELIRSSALRVMDVSGDGWRHVWPHMSSFQREAHGRFSSLRVDPSLGRGVNVAELERMVMWHARSALDCLVALRGRFLSPGKGTRADRT